MRIEQIQATNFYTKITHNKNKNQQNNMINSQSMVSLPNFGYGKDLINKKPIAFKGNEIQKAASTLLSQFPFEDRLASLLQHLNIGELVVTGKDFNTAQKALLKHIKGFDQIIKKEIFMKEESLKHNYAFLNTI